ncbi:MAG TPA: hypothetical protein EYP14_10275, partial [Planctomycetaceae bacterium]|nr:hypothetical protein [Planctomycetaceae bacterium]
MPEQRWTARWIFPVSGPPIENGTLIASDGVIEDVWPSQDARALDLGPVALIPGLVNAHTHLEFSDLNAPLAAPGCNFFEWIPFVVAYRLRRSLAGASAVRRALERGLRECHGTATAVVADIVTTEYEPAQFPGPRSQLVLFRELYTLRPKQISPQLELARRHLERFGPASEGIAAVGGLSPHAPYTVHPELFEKLIELARRHRAPVAMHLAETEAERELLECGTGPCVELLRRFGLWKANLFERGVTILDYLRKLAETERALVIHGNYLNNDDIAFLADHPHLCVVYCPRSHAYFGHRPHRWQQMLDQGVSVAIGTDSRASNPDLSVW